jgi:TolB protein
MLTAIGAVALAVAAALTPSAAVAAFPGGNGRIAFEGGPRPGEQYNIFSVRPDGSGLQQLTDDREFDRAPSWSADGGHLVFSRDVGGGAALFTINADGEDLTRVVDGLDHGTPAPSFSPSGRRIVYTTGDSLRTIHPDGSGSRQVVGRVAGRVQDPQYSPDGKRIVTGSAGGGGGGIWSMRRDGSHPRQLTDPDPDAWDQTPDYSPDGRHIAFVRCASHSCDEIRVVRADGSHERPIPIGAGSPFSPAYAPAGDRMALPILSGTPPYLACHDLYTISLSGSDRLNLTNSGCDPSGQGQGYVAWSPSWQPDPPTTFGFGKVKKNRRKGIAKLPVIVPGPGELGLARTRKVKGASERAEAEGGVELPVKPKGKARKRLRRDGSVKVRADVTYTPDGAGPNTQSKKLKLKKR